MATLDRRKLVMGSLAAGIGVGLGPTLVACGAQSPKSDGGKQTFPRLAMALGDVGNWALDPLKGPNDNGVYLNFLYDPIIGVDRRARQLSKETGIARDWQIAADKLTYTLDIRRGVKFHNGDDLAADDVVFTLQRLSQKDDATSAGVSTAANFASVRAVDDYTVEIKLKQPMPTLLYRLSPIYDTSGLVVPKKHLSSVGAAAFGRAPIGTGPYKFKSQKASYSVTLERATSKHFAVGNPRFDEVVVTGVDNVSSRVSLLRSGQADFVDIGSLQAAQLKGSHFQTFTSPLPEMLGLFFNNNPSFPNSPTMDLRVRQALALGIDSTSLNKAFFSGQASPTGNIFPGQLGADVIPPTTFDPGKAKQLLSAAGFGSGGNPLQMQIQAQVQPGVSNAQQIAEAIQAEWKAIGVDSSVVFGDFGSWRSKAVAGSLPAGEVELLTAGGKIDAAGTADFFFTFPGELHTAVKNDDHLNQLIQSWNSAATLEVAGTWAKKTEGYLTQQTYVIPLVNVPPIYAATDKIPSDFDPGDISITFNERGLIWG